MELTLLKEFVILAETCSFQETAERLFTTQSTISKHLKQLETELGVRLFERTSRRVTLSEQGELFLPYARKMLQIQYDYQTAFYNQDKAARSTLTIGSIPGMAQYNITDILVRFNKENKNIRLNIIEAESIELIHLLRHNQCELAFVRELNENSSDLIKIPYCSDYLAALLPVSHPLANRYSLCLEELKEEDFLLIRENTFLYNLSVNACKKAGFTPHILYSGHHLDNIIDLTAKNMGIALLMMKQTANLSTDQVRAVRIEPAVSSQISLAACKNTRLSLAARRFLDCVRR